MKIVLAPYGSRGDVAPFCALGRELAERGHTVILCAPPDYQPLADQAGIPFRAAGPGFATLFDGSQSNWNLLRRAAKHLDAVHEVLLREARDASAIVGAALQFAGPLVARRLGVPYGYVMYSPMYLRSTQLPSLQLRRESLPAMVHRAVWAVEDMVQRRQLPRLGVMLAEAGIPRLHSVHDYLTRSGQLLLAADPLLAPAPTDSGRVEQSGYMFPAVAAAQPVSGELESFLRAGDRPVYVGFGSMRSGDARGLARELAQVMLQSPMRFVVHGDWTAYLPADISTSWRVHVQGSAEDHGSLFKRVRAVVHHGGAGTTSTAAMAGVPQFLLPHLGDQFYHAGRVAALGLGPAAVPEHSLSAAPLLRGIAEIEEGRFDAAAREFAASMRTRSGTARAAQWVESLATQPA